MFERPPHQRIAQALGALNGALLKEHCCLFGGGTAMVLRFGEYRESIDIDFLQSDMTGYRSLRQLLTDSGGISAILLPGQPPLAQLRDIRADQYGIRTMLSLAGRPVKFEIVLEGGSHAVTQPPVGAPRRVTQRKTTGVFWCKP